jgi:hypothetical protein
MVHLIRAARLVRTGRKSEHRLPHLVRAATGEEGGIHSPPPECCRGAPPPQAPLLTRAAASGPEAERPRTAGLGATEGGATGPLPEWWRRDSHRLAALGVSAEPLSAPRILGRRVKSVREKGWLDHRRQPWPARSPTDRSLFRVLRWRSVILRCASDKLRCSIWPNRSRI